MSTVRFEHVTKRYAGLTALEDVDLTIETDRVAVLCGPPRSGKSTLLRLLVGLETPDAGRILIDGDDVTSLPAARRHVGYVPQSFALFPHMSVRDNIAYPLRQRGVTTAEIAQRVDRTAAMLRITALLGKRPSQLSGGEKQRAAIARGTLQDARIFALDDPLVGLDFKLRESLMDELKDMREALGATFVYATSDPLEALTMGDELAVLDGGRLVEAGPSERVYLHPSSRRSAELIGFPRCNVIDGTADDVECETSLARFALVPARGRDGDPTSTRVRTQVEIAIRPEHVVLNSRDAPDRPGTAIEGVGRITLIESLGAECVVHVDANGIMLVSTPSADATAQLSVGSDVAFRIGSEALMVFDARHGARLGYGAADA